MNAIRSSITKRQEAGFSLVEMAIVLVIIGLIVSAIAVGKTTMRKGEAVKAYQQFINPSIQAAISHYESVGSSIGGAKDPNPECWGAVQDLDQDPNQPGYAIGQGKVKRADTCPTFSPPSASTPAKLTITFAFDADMTDDDMAEVKSVFNGALSGIAEVEFSGTKPSRVMKATFKVPLVGKPTISG
ncbi:MAG: prepilin-type N-terminal cleavage/methylation domain-containing protein [Magnetococcus sp. YQC-5]